MAPQEDSRSSPGDEHHPIDSPDSVTRIERPKNILDYFKPDDSVPPFSHQLPAIDRGGPPCLCGCGESPKGKKSRFVQGHSRKALAKIVDILGPGWHYEGWEGYQGYLRGVEEAADIVGGQDLVNWIRSDPKHDWYDRAWHTHRR